MSTAPPALSGDPCWVNSIRASITARNDAETRPFKPIVDGYSQLQTDYNDAVLHIVSLSRECTRLRTLISSGAASLPAHADASAAAAAIAAEEAALNDPSAAAAPSPLAAAFAFAASRPQAWLGFQGLSNLLFSGGSGSAGSSDPAEQHQQQQEAAALASALPPLHSQQQPHSANANAQAQAQQHGHEHAHGAAAAVAGSPRASLVTSSSAGTLGVPHPVTASSSASAGSGAGAGSGARPSPPSSPTASASASAGAASASAAGPATLTAAATASAASSSAAAAAAAAASMAPTTAGLSLADLRALVAKLTADSARRARDLSLADRRLAHTDALLVAREGTIAALRRERDEAARDGAVRKGYVEALERKLALAHQDASEWQERGARLKQAETEAARARAELMALKASVALGAAGDALTGGAGSTPTRGGAGGAGGETVLRFSADDLQRSTVAWGVKSRPVPPVTVRVHREAHRGVPATACRYHCDGAVLVTAGADGAVKFHQARTGKPGLSVLASQHALSSLSTAPDGATIAFGGADKKAYVWNTFTRQAPRTWTLAGEVVGLGFLGPDRLVTAARSRTDCFRLVNVGESSDSVLGINIGGRGGGGGGGSVAGGDASSAVVVESAPVAMAVASLTSRFASAHLDKSIRLWSVSGSAVADSGSGSGNGNGDMTEIGVVEDAHSQRITSIDFDATQNLLLTNSWDGCIQVRDVRAALGEPTVQLSGLGGALGAYVNRQELTRAAFSPDPDARYVVAGDNLGRVAFWDLRNTSKPATVVNTPAYNPRAPAAAPAGAGGASALSSAITCVDWNPNGRQVACVNRMGFVTLIEDEVVVSDINSNKPGGGAATAHSGTGLSPGMEALRRL